MGAQAPTSPWWGQYWAATLLHRAAAEGATITNYAEYFGGVDSFDDEPDEWFLNVAFAMPDRCRAVVRYTGDRGHWILLTDTEPLDEADVDMQMSAAYTVGLAAKLCRDMNALVMRRHRGGYAALALSEELEALIGDRGISRAEFAAQLGMTHGVLTSKMRGSTAWSAVDLLRAARVLDDDGRDVLDRLLGTVPAGTYAHAV